MLTYRTKTLFVLVGLTCLALKLLVIDVKRLEISIRDLSTRTIEYKYLFGTNVRLTSEKETTRIQTELSKFLVSHKFVPSIKKLQTNEYIPVSYKETYSKVLYGTNYQLWRELEQFSHGESWVEWSVKHPKKAKSFWERLFFLLQLPNHGDGLAIMLVKDVKSNPDLTEEGKKN